MIDICQHSFNTVYNAKSKVLILGSFPPLLQNLLAFTM